MTQPKETTIEQNSQLSSEGQPLDELSELEIDIAKVEARLKNEREHIRIIPIVVGAFFVLFGIAFKLYPEIFHDKIFNFFLIASGLFGSFAMYFMYRSSITAMQADLDVLNARKRILNRFAAGSSPGAATQSEASYFDSLVRINVDNLAAYYSLVKVHTDKSFMVSIVVGCIGFILIIAGLILGFSDNANAKTISFIASGTGILTEFIGGVFFYLYNRTVRQMKEYHDSLLTVQNILLSFKIVGDTKDEKEKVSMVGQMLVYLIGKPNLPANLAFAASDKKNGKPENQ